MHRTIVDLKENGTSVKELMEAFKRKLAVDGYTRKRLPGEFLFQKPKNLTDRPVTLIGFDGDVEFKLILSEIRKKHLCPLDMKRFLKFGKQHQEIISEFPVITFSAVWRRNADLFVPCLWKDFSSVPDLWLLFELWRPSCLFATI